MQAINTISPASWVGSTDPMVWEQIFQPTVSTAIWQRQSNPQVEDYLAAVLPSLGQGLRNVYDVEHLVDELDKRLPEQAQFQLGRQALIADIYLLSDMLTCLFDCQSVGLRLVPLDKQMCPKLHVDNIPVRLVSTYLGPATEWLPSEFSEVEDGKLIIPRHSPKGQIKQMKTADAALLKGAAWEGHEHMAAIHRSCAVPANQGRVLLSLDPL